MTESTWGLISCLLTLVISSSLISSQLFLVGAQKEDIFFFLFFPSEHEQYVTYLRCQNNVLSFRYIVRNNSTFLKL